MHGGSMSSLWIYLVGPILGGLAGSAIWAFQEQSDPAPIERPASAGIDQPATGHAVRE